MTGVVYKGRLFGTDVAVKILEKKKKGVIPDEMKVNQSTDSLRSIGSLGVDSGLGGSDGFRVGSDGVDRGASEEERTHVASSTGQARPSNEDLELDMSEDDESEACDEENGLSQAQELSTGSHKTSERDSSCGSQNEVIRYEIGVMSEINHPNILKFLGTCASRELGQCIIVEYIDGGDDVSFLLAHD